MPTVTENSRLSYVRKGLFILLAVSFFLLSLNLLGATFQRTSSWAFPNILSITQNPFISLFIGLLITALIQSSSTVTSIIVAAVAAGTLPLTQAIPMVMGANIGTTLTSALVSLGFITQRNEFKRAIGAGTVHTFFNIITVCVLLPLELYTGALSDVSLAIAGWLSPAGEQALASTDDFTYGFWHTLISLEWLNQGIKTDIVLIVISLVMLFVSIKWLASLIYQLFIGRFKANFQHLVFSSRWRAFAWGGVLTAAVQSSSVTTPLVVPLVATGKVSLRKCFPYIIGANLGTTITALLAALFHSQAALSIAITHVLFNLVGVLLFLPKTSVGNIPVRLALQLGRFTTANRLVGFAFVLLTFFLIPFLLIYLHN